MKAHRIGCTVAALLLAAPVMADEALARLYGCLECHAEGESSVGPEPAQIAARYTEIEGARAELIEVVKKGGKGEWPEVSRGAPMPPYEGAISEEDIERLIDWMLGL